MKTLSAEADRLGEVELMNFYYINTEAKNQGESPHKIWFEHNYAFVSGEKYGKRLEKFEPGDILFMYANKMGVIAVGMVLEKWDGEKADPQLVYTEEQGPEYRVKTKWFLTFDNDPITPPALREIVGWISPQTIARITSITACENLLEVACKREASKF